MLTELIPMIICSIKACDMVIMVINIGISFSGACSHQLLGVSVSRLCLTV